jgi:hypothetical protein
MRLHIVALMFALASAGCVTHASDQYAAVASSLGVAKEEVASVARQASTKHKMVVVWVKKTEDGGIEVALADKPERAHGIIVVFRKVAGEWQEDPKSQDEWIV